LDGKKPCRRRGMMLAASAAWLEIVEGSATVADQAVADAWLRWGQSGAVGHQRGCEGQAQRSERATYQRGLVVPPDR
jgi:hypothetical protein